MNICVSNEEMAALRRGSYIVTAIPIECCICKTEHDELQATVTLASVDWKTRTVQLCLVYPESPNLELIKAYVTGQTGGDANAVANEIYPTDIGSEDAGPDNPVNV